MVPEGWKERKLGQVAFLQRGFDLPGRERVEGDIPIISSSGISGYHNEHQVEGPGVVTGRYGTIGEVFFVQNKFWPLNTALWVKEFHGNDQKYVYYLLSKIDYKKFSDKTGIPGVNRNDLHTVKVPVPPRNEQKKIARILSTCDKAIETVKKLIENSKAQKKALMQQLLAGKPRQSGSSNERRRLHISDVAKVDVRSLSIKTPTDYSFRYISLSDVNNGQISDNLNSYVFSSAPSRARRVVEEGDILMATVRPNLQAFARVGTKHGGCIASTGFAVLSPKKNFDGDYLYHYLFSSHVTGQLSALVVGSGYPALNSSDVKGLTIYCPAYEEQRAIANILNKADSVVENLLRQSSRLKEQKKALMQQLLTGKRRVKVDES